MIRRTVCACLTAASLTFAPGAYAELNGRVPEPGMVTMADFGAESCLPCKAMAPILKKLDKEYEGRAAVRFINTVQGSSSKPPSLNDGGADLFKRVTFDQVLKSVESSRER